MITLESSISFSNVRAISKQQSDRQTKVAKAHVPRISRLMALAIRLDLLIREGVVADQAELARLGNVTRARLTQIMNLLFLAPIIQEQILDLTAFSNTQNNISERHLRPISLMPDWKQQLSAWLQIVSDEVN